MSAIHLIIGALACGAIGGLAGFVLACIFARNAWVDGFRAGFGKATVEPRHPGEIDGARAPRNERREACFFSPEDAPVLTSYWEAEREMWRTVPLEDIEAAEAEQVRLGTTVWAVIATIVICGALLLFAKRVFDTEDAALRARAEAGRVVFPDKITGTERGAQQ